MLEGEAMRTYKLCWMITVLILSMVPLAAQDDTTLTVIAWNLESGDILPDVISEELQQFDDVHIWGLSEVFDGHTERFEHAIESDEHADYETILGTTGFGDRLVIIYDTSRLMLIHSEELMDISLGGSVRAPLIAEFEDQLTGKHFLFGVNHLARGNEFGRHTQAQLLNQWGSTQTLPIILSGDFNFDYEVDGSSYDNGYGNLIADGVFTWVQPVELVRTQCSARDNAREAGIPEAEACRYNSVLDFVFVGGDAQSWLGESLIIVRDDDFPDDVATSDHRPILVQFSFDPAPTKAEILERIDRLEQELAELRALVEQLP